MGTGCIVPCSANEGHLRSCSLIREAVEDWAWKHWPGERPYTYVGGQLFVATSPGHAFRCAGWTGAAAHSAG